MKTPWKCRLFGHKAEKVVYEGFFKSILKQYICTRCGKLYWIGPMNVQIDDDDPRLGMR